MIQETFPIIVGGVEVLNERILLTQVENGLLMNGADSVRFIVIHCSATRCDRDYTVEQSQGPWFSNHRLPLLHPQKRCCDTTSQITGGGRTCPWFQSVQHRYLL